ncbi:MAG: 4-hydroxythreonine-4-phosphate dehydrogenase PdxA [Magnetococcales bacterium]|nr:4-hydroxythreonine-4-phosphate dehydrogenase PdxA [Magnetococcales bacterium]
MIAITQGDPSGVGLEIAIKGFSPSPRRVHVGQRALYQQTAEALGLDRPLKEVSSVEHARSQPADQFLILSPNQGSRRTADFGPIRFGQAQPHLAQTTVDSIKLACQLAMDGVVDGIVTPPINKSVIHEAGYPFPGHTEMLAAFTGVDTPVMMLVTDGLRVVPATIHIALSEVAKVLSQPLLEQVIRTTHSAMQRDFNLEKPRITVTGLNPHAGEMGAFGQEEVAFITPLCQRLDRELTGEIRGPLPADSLFHEAARKTYDAIICMYHDQALIPLKMLGFGHAVNTTLGLPIVRTSVDHGTAYNIAGKGIADPSSYIEALDLAETMIANRRSSE